jgi:phosphopantetheinyl transferase
MIGKLSAFDRLIASMDVFGAVAPGISIAVTQNDGQFSDTDLAPVLSRNEILRASEFSIREEQQHYLFRRCFQRLFVARVCGWDGDLSELPLVHSLDQRPSLDNNPNIQFSFSSSQGCYLFGAAESGALGVDIETVRPIENVVNLAKRFFTMQEAAAVEALRESERHDYFLTLWSAKEAGLKAIGRGVDFGLNVFTFKKRDATWHVVDAPSTSKPWKLSLPDANRGRIVTVMHRAG